MLARWFGDSGGEELTTTPTLTDTGSALLRAILEEPEDDSLRLIYADWCEDNGQPERAEFIRVQIEMTRLEGKEVRPLAQSAAGLAVILNATLDFQRGELLRRERELLDANDFVEWPAWMDEWAFRRGFVEYIRLPLQAFLHNTGVIFSTAPVLAVRLTDREPTGGPPDGTCIWWRQRADDASNLPAVLFDLLTGHVRTGCPEQAPPSHRHYFTAESAHAALSTACLTLGRNLAGLPPLKGT